MDTSFRIDAKQVVRNLRDRLADGSLLILLASLAVVLAIGLHPR